MKNYILTFAALLFLCTLTAQNDDPDLNELLSRLQQNHMGSINDVFNEEELAVLKNHFHSNAGPTNAESVLVRRRARATQSVAPLSVVEINPLDLSQIQNLGIPSTTEFEGAGVTIVNQGRSLIIDNNNRVFLRGMNTGQYQDTGVNINTIPAEVITGIEVLSNGEMYGIGTNGMNSSHLYHINRTNYTSTVIGGNNGRILPINLARTIDDKLVTIDIDDDIAYGIDVATGVTTPIGSIGFDANFGQGMGYDAVSDEILLLAFNNTTFSSELRRMNFDTGLTVNLGQITPGQTYQFGWGSFFDKDLLATTDHEQSSLVLYPNPVEDQLNIMGISDIERIEIFDITGKKVFTDTTGAQSTRLSLSNLQSGMYLLRATVDGVEFTHKIVKK